MISIGRCRFRGNSVSRQNLWLFIVAHSSKITTDRNTNRVFSNSTVRVRGIGSANSYVRSMRVQQPVCGDYSITIIIIMPLIILLFRYFWSELVTRSRIFAKTHTAKHVNPRLASLPTVAVTCTVRENPANHLRRNLLQIGIIWNPVGESTDIYRIDP